MSSVFPKSIDYRELPITELNIDPLVKEMDNH